jgi:hypothetical protein
MNEKRDTQPEALATFSAAAKTKDKVKPAGQGLHAKEDTRARNDDLAREQKDAAKIYQAGAEKNPRKADEAIEDRKKVDKRSL